MAKFWCYLLVCLAVVFHLGIIDAATYDTDNRLDCTLTGSPITSEQDCKKRGCLWSKSRSSENQTDVPQCFLDRIKVGYSVQKSSIKQKNNQLVAELTLNPETEKVTTNTKIKLVPKLRLEVFSLTENIVRVRLIDPASKRYEVPLQHSVFRIPDQTLSNITNYEVALSGVSSSLFNLTITRKESNVKIFDTSIGGLIYGDTFLQIVTNLASKDVYGIGENIRSTFRHDIEHYHTLPVFARDRLTGSVIGSNHYGSHPFFTILESDGKSSGIFLLNSNAMSFTTIPSGAMSIKAFGGILDLFVLVGDNPEHVVQLYTSIIGRPVMPPFWALGFQLCRYGYKNLNHVKKVVKRQLDNNVPLDVHYMDIDYMDEYRDFTYDKVKFSGLPEYVNETKSKHNLRWTLIIDPAIQGDKPGYRAFEEGYKQDVFVKWPQSVPMAKRTKPGNAPMDKGVMYGKVWPNGPAGFPDFFKNSTKKWWIQMLKELHEEIAYDAIWIDMNEPSNFASNYLQCPQDDEFEFLRPSQNFPDKLNTGTLCMSAVQGENGEYRHYDVHSLYGWSETQPTLQGVHEATGKRGFVVTRSTYPSSGQFAAHWLGDNSAKWENLRQSIVGMLDFSLFGISFTGADICGFNGNTNPELCRRWLQLGAYYPYSRSHNDIGDIDQDPGFWIENGHPEVTKAAIDSLRTRYQLLHYLYTRFYRSHVFGETLVRPVAHEYPLDATARDISHQFFLGSSLMVNPFVEQGKNISTAYVPKDDWYKFSGMFVEQITSQNTSDHRYTFEDDESHRPLLLRGGSILPIVNEAQLPSPLNTATLRTVPIQLWVLPDTAGNATGDLFYDDGETIDTVASGDYNYYQFSLSECVLRVEAKHFGYKARSSSNSKDILQVATIVVPLSDEAAKAENLEVTMSGTNEKLNATVADKTLQIAVNNLNLLQESNKNVTIVIKNKTSAAKNSCSIHAH